ncbi:MAG: D-alanyl-D-alanine carboxypeptidase [Firmicutes bacterium]|nr:D-alanyl-D-alanine carboxypeptidase [Bacillota bacterium]
MRRLIVATLTAFLLFNALPVQAEVPDYEGELASSSAVLLDAATGQVLFEKDPHLQLAPASITKIMTMLLVMEALERQEISLDEVMITSSRAKGMGGTQIFLETDDEITVEEAMIGMAVESANDAAVVVAEHLGGSVEGFVEMMNRRARELGMENTHFVNPTGLPENGGEGSMTTAYDVALMARELLKHPQITQWTTIPWDTQFMGRVYIANKNLSFLRTYPGGDGLKTGWTEEAGYCLAATALRDSTRMIAVVMDAPTYTLRTQDAINLLNYGFGHWRSEVLHQRGEVLGTVPVDKGRQEVLDLITANDVTMLIDKTADGEPEVKLNLPGHVQAPVSQGEVVGTVEVLLNDEVVETVDLIAAEAVAKANWFQMIGKIMRSLLETIR